jgi:hypothetical protein
MIIIFMIAEKLTSSALYGKFSQNTSIKHCGLTLTATKLIFIPQNKEQPHQTNGANGLHSV